MPATLIITILVLSALSGYCIASMLTGMIFYPLKEKRIFGYSISGIVPANHRKLAAAIATAVNSNWLTAENVTQAVARKGIMEKLRPEIEIHVDLFLKEKIRETFPLLYKFMGDNTLAKFKEAFLSEVELLFPALLQSYTTAMLKDIDPKRILEEKINAIPITALADTFKKNAGKKLFAAKVLAAGIGLITGIIQILCILLLNR